MRRQKNVSPGTAQPGDANPPPTVNPIVLIEYVKLRFSSMSDTVLDGTMTDTDVAELLGVTRQSINNMRNKGRMSVYAADHYAVAVLGVHPCEIWGEEWWNANGVPPCGQEVETGE